MENFLVTRMVNGRIRHIYTDGERQYYIVDGEHHYIDAPTKVAENGRTLKPHDGCTEWSVCGACGTSIDWANDVMFGPASGRDRDDTTCPYCGHEDTAWLYAD